MSLKYQIDSLDGVDESVKSLYTEKEGKFILAIEGMPQQEDVSGLKSKVDELLAEKKAVALKAKEAEAAAAKAAEEAARKSGDTEALEKSWQEKLATREAELNGQIEQMTGAVNNMTVNSEAIRIATELAVQGSADILIPHIKSRLAAEQRDGQFVTVVRDAQGKPSASTLDDLKTEFANNPAFAPVIVGSKATGGGAGGSKQGGGGATNKTVTRGQFEQMGATERMTFAKDGGTITDE